jgi:hypothetical protein
MFKNIQQKLLISQPLLWNLKIVPTSSALILINIIFLIVGYFNGELNFSEDGNNFSSGNDAIIIFFSILITILGVILWLVYYLKNNSFKSVYPKNNFSLFKEWFLILLICFLACLFTASYYYGKETKVRSYYSEKEAKKRCDILSKGSYFINNSYSNNYKNNVYENGVEEVVNSVTDSVDAVYSDIIYKGKKYKYFSLLNKNLNSYSFFNFEQDSLRKNTIKDWLVNNKKDSLHTLFKNYLAVVKEHNLKASIDENQWFSFVYDYPNYEKFKTIGNQFQDENYYDNEYENTAVKIDTTDRFIRSSNGIKQLYYKYYLPEKKLNYNYEKIADAWVSPVVSSEYILILSYFAIGLSLLIFSFRVTSGRNWLIAIVAIGIINIVLGILSLIISSKYSYPVLLMLIMIALFVYFYIVLIKNRGKAISGITINAMLWSIPGLIPLGYFLFIEFYKEYIGYYVLDYEESIKKFPFVKTLQDNYLNMMYCNLIFIFIMMLLISSKIKKWKGLAES